MDDLLERCERLLAGNTQSGAKDGRRHVFSVPSVGAYPFQWFWDSCFHAIVWAKIDPERAAEELRSLLAWQRADGLVPHVIFWNRSRIRARTWHRLESGGGLQELVPWAPRPWTTAMMQPPVLAQAVERVDAALPGFAAEVLPAVERFYRWLCEVRDPDGDGLVSIVSQFEGGLDYSPAHDAVIGIRRPNALELAVRPRLVELWDKSVAWDERRIFQRFGHHLESVLVNTIHAQGLATLGRLGVEWAPAAARRTLAALLERSWDERAGLFWNLTGPAETPAKVKTVISLLPLALPDLPQDVAARLVEHLTDAREFWSPYPVPSVALDEPTFVRRSRVGGVRFIWRGPLSLNTNWFLVHGLRAHGYGDIAETIAERSRELVDRGGFNEFFDPVDGKPAGADQFGWATLASDLGP